MSHTVRITDELKDALGQARNTGESYGAVIERLVSKELTVKSHNTPGKGNKFCPHCENKIGNRTKVCPRCKEVLQESRNHVRFHYAHSKAKSWKPRVDELLQFLQSPSNEETLFCPQPILVDQSEYSKVLMEALRSDSPLKQRLKSIISESLSIEETKDGIS